MKLNFFVYCTIEKEVEMSEENYNRLIGPARFEDEDRDYSDLEYFLLKQCVDDFLDTSEIEYIQDETASGILLASESLIDSEYLEGKKR